jgi:hypothetical protein
MLAFPSQPRPSAGAPGDRSSGRRALDLDIDRQRIALEERYSLLLAARNPASADELYRLRTRLHQLAEINGDATAPARENALRAWLRAKP